MSLVVLVVEAWGSAFSWLPRPGLCPLRSVPSMLCARHLILHIFPFLIAVSADQTVSSISCCGGGVLALTERIVCVCLGPGTFWLRVSTGTV